MENRVERAFDEDVMGHIVMNERELRLPGQMGDIVRGPGQKIVQANDFVPVGEEAVAKVAADEPGPPRL